MEPPVYLVVGPPAAGKTTVARALAATFERSIHVPVDQLRQMVVGGMAWPAPDWSAELVGQVRLARETAIRMAQAYQAAGFTVVLDDFFDPPGALEYRRFVRHPATLAVLLCPSQAEAHHRNAMRGGGTPDPGVDLAILHAYGFLPPVVDALAADGWLVLDTTGLDVPATVRAILDGTGTG